MGPVVQEVNITARIAAVNDSSINPIVGTVISADKMVLRAQHHDPSLPQGTDRVDADLHINKLNGTIPVDLTLSVVKVVNLTVTGGAADLELHLSKMHNGTSKEDSVGNTKLTLDQFENNTASSPAPTGPGYC